MPAPSRDAHHRRVRALRLPLRLHSAEPNSETMEWKTTWAERKTALPGWHRLPYDVVDAGDKAIEENHRALSRRAHGRKLDVTTKNALSPRVKRTDAFEAA